MTSVSVIDVKVKIEWQAMFVFETSCLKTLKPSTTIPQSKKLSH